MNGNFVTQFCINNGFHLIFSGNNLNEIQKLLRGQNLNKFIGLLDLVNQLVLVPTKMEFNLSFRGKPDTKSKLIVTQGPGIKEELGRHFKPSKNKLKLPKLGTKRMVALEVLWKNLQQKNKYPRINVR